MSLHRAIITSSLTKYSTTIMSLASMMIVARLLTPSQLGTFSIGSAIILSLTEFRVLGAGQYLVRQHDLTPEKVKSALGLTIIVSWGLGIIVASMALPFSRYYGIPDLAPIFWILSVGFVLGPFLGINTALLARDMRFDLIFRIRFYSSLSSIFVTLFLIFNGYGYFSLALGQAALQIVAFVLAVVLHSSDMLWIPRFKDLKKIALFGLYNSTGNFLRKSVVTVPDVIIGKLGTAAQVGLYSRGMGFIDFVSQNLLMGVNPVILPFFSKKTNRNEKNMAYIQSGVLMGGALWPVLAVASVVSLPAIKIFFGDQWDQAASFASFLAFWAMLRSVHWFSNDFFIANGDEKFMLIKECISFFIHVLAIFLAFPFGLEAVAASYVVAGGIEFAITSFFLSTRLNISQMSYFKAWMPNVLLTVICWGSAALIYNTCIYLGAGFITGLLIVALLLPPIWLAGLFFAGHPLGNEVFSLIKIRSRRIMK